MKKKFITSITAEAKAGKAYIRIVDYIVEWTASSATKIREQVDAMLAQGITEAEVYVNSRGGDVFEAVEIANELARFEKVAIRVGAVAASATTYLTSKFYTTAKLNSQIMIHRPSMGVYGDIITVTANLVLLTNTTQDYKSTYAVKTGKSEDDIEAMWAKGDVWMTAKQAKEEGFINELDNEDVAITEADIVLLEACAAPTIPTIVSTTNSNTEKMDRVLLIAALGLAANATDAQIEAAVKLNKEKAEQFATVEANAAGVAKANAETLVLKAISDKKITATQKDHYVKLATLDYDSTKAILEAATEIPKLSAQLEGTAPSADATDRKGWTLDDYLDKAPQIYAQMKKEEPEAAKALEDAYFADKGKKK